MAEPPPRLPSRRARRAGPPVPFRLRSRIVAWAKILLPLAALALLSTVFLLARAPGGPVDIPYSRLAEIARDPRMDRPRLSGVAPDGTILALTADRVAPQAGRPDTFALEEPRLETEGRDGIATLAAATGEVDAAARTLRLSGGVRIESSAGLVVDAPEVAADLSTGTLTAGPVTATAPLGEIEAGGLTFRQGEGEGARLVFNRGVRVLYHPPDRPSPEAP